MCTNQHTGRMADRLHALMGDLGYSRYGVHGGDFGWSIGTTLGGRFPRRSCACSPNVRRGPSRRGGSPPHRSRRFSTVTHTSRQRAWAYGKIQGTRPQTLAVADGLARRATRVDPREVLGLV